MTWEHDRFALNPTLELCAVTVLPRSKLSLSGIALGFLIVFYSLSSSPLVAQGNFSMIEPSPVSGVSFRQIQANGLNFRIAVAGF